MNASHVLPRLKFVDHTNADLGTGTVIVPDRHGAVVRLNLTANTSFTVPIPTRAGPDFFLNHVSGAYTATITFASAYNEAGTTAYTMNSPGQIAHFKACETASGTFAWRLLGSDGAVTPVNGNMTVAGTLDVTGATTLAGLTVGGVVQAPVFVPDATPYTVLAANSGKLHVILEQASSITLNLPVIAAGVSYKFVMGGVATEAQNWVIVATTPSFYNGGIAWTDLNDAESNLAVVYANGTSHLTLTVTTPAAGTEIEISSNGTEWFVHATVISDSTPAFT